ncbi:MAG: acyltransferase [Actinomycetota bacterium]|nr:acyltransferase [Actinomycetota bacterium]
MTEVDSDRLSAEPSPDPFRLPQRSRIRPLPGLDGLRAFAVVAAMLFHANVLHGGFLGVDLFFVLSGFLITSLLVNEAFSARDGSRHRRWRPHIDLSTFWARRVRRLAPALLLVIAVVVIWSYNYASVAMAQSTTKAAGWSLFNLNNWFAIFGNVGYWGVAATKTPLNHIWSLAIEEQFYLVWPVVLAVVLRFARTTKPIAVLAAAFLVASAGWQVWVAGHYGTLRAYLGTDTRADALFAGCLLAVLLARHVQDPAASVSSSEARWAWTAAVAGSIAWLGYSWATANFELLDLYRGWLISCSVAAGVVIAGVVLNPASAYTRVLATPALTWVGKRSYSLYLWHWPLWVMITPAMVGGSVAGLWVVRVAVTVAVAALSYSFVEMPIRVGRMSGRRVVSAALASAVAIAVVVVAFPPSLPRTLRNQPITLAGKGGSGSLTVLVAGDSWAQNMGYALRLSDPAQRNTFINDGAPGCGLLNGDAAGDCHRQSALWANAFATAHPNVALLMEGTVDTNVGATVDGKHVYPCDPSFDAAYAKALDTAIAALHGPTMLPVYVATVRDDEGGQVSRSNCINADVRSAAARDSARVADLNALLCPRHSCPSTHDGQPVYDDTGHLAPAGQRWIGGWLLDLMHRQVSGAAVATKPGACAEAATPIGLAAKPYISAPDPEYPDQTGHELTDGHLARADISDPGWQAWRTQSASVIFQLSRTQAVCSVSTTWLQQLSAAVYIPSQITVYVSPTPTTGGQLLGTAQGAAPSTAQQAVTVRVNGATPIRGRYVTVAMQETVGWMFSDEMSLEGP